MDEKIMIIGACGLIGHALWDEFEKEESEVLAVDNDPLVPGVRTADITDREGIRSLLREIRPGVVILTAALSFVDYCEEHPAESERVNITGLRNVLDAMEGVTDRLVFMSSDYVFDGLNGPYGEDDTPAPLNVYGRHKLEGERLITSRLKRALIIRTTWVYGPETVDRGSFARTVCHVFDLPEEHLLPMATEFLGQKARRPLKAGLRTDKLQRDVGLPLIDYHRGLNETRRILASGEWHGRT